MSERITPASEINKLGLTLRQSGALPAGEAFVEYLESLERDTNRETLKTGFVDLDKILGGLRPEELIIIAARPGFGKTNLALQIARNVAVEQGQAVGYLSLETSTGEQIVNLMRLETGMDHQRLKSYFNSKICPKEREVQKVSGAGKTFAKAPLYFDDSDHDLPSLHEKMQAMVKDYGVKLIVIDSVQDLIKNSYLWNKMDIMHCLRLIAKELGITVILLSTVSHQVEFRRNHVPGLGDLEGLEISPHVVIFLYHEAWYNRETERTGVVDAYVRKNKNGPTGQVSLLFQESIGKFFDFAPYREDAR